MKISRLIRVGGLADSGKTTIITWCFHQFLETASLNGFKTMANGDFVAVITHKKDKIAFVSGGDNKRQTKAGYKALEELGIKDIAVCVFATRTKGGSVQFWREIEKANKTKIKFLRQKCAKAKSVKEINAYNQLHSDKLAKEIEKTLKEKK